MRFLAAAALAGALLATPSVAVAGPISLNYTGTWTFHDPASDTPEFWTAMASAGIFQGSPLTWTLLVDDSALDLNPDPSVGVYNAILSSHLQIGSLSLTSGPATLKVDSTGPAFTWFGSMGPSVSGFMPQYLQLHSGFAPVLSSDLLGPALDSIGTNPAQPSRLTIGFNLFCGPGGVCAQFLGLTSLSRTAAVPEAGPLALIAAGLLALLVVRATRSRSAAPEATNARR